MTAVLGIADCAYARALPLFLCRPDPNVHPTYRSRKAAAEACVLPLPTYHLCALRPITPLHTPPPSRTPMHTAMQADRSERGQAAEGGGADPDATAVDGVDVDAEGDASSCPGWQEAYFGLLLLEKMAGQQPGTGASAAAPALAWKGGAAGVEAPALWDAVCRLLLHRHVWVRKAAARLVGLGLATQQVRLRGRAGLGRVCFLRDAAGVGRLWPSGGRGLGMDMGSWSATRARLVVRRSPSALASGPEGEGNLLCRAGRLLAPVCGQERSQPLAAADTCCPTSHLTLCKMNPKSACLLLASPLLACLRGPQISRGLLASGGSAATGSRAGQLAFALYTQIDCEVADDATCMQVRAGCSGQLRGLSGGGVPGLSMQMGATGRVGLARVYVRLRWGPAAQIRAAARHMQSWRPQQTTGC